MSGHLSANELTAIYDDSTEKLYLWAKGTFNEKSAFFKEPEIPHPEGPLHVEFIGEKDSMELIRYYAQAFDIKPTDIRLTHPNVLIKHEPEDPAWVEIVRTGQIWPDKN